MLVASYVFILNSFYIFIFRLSLEIVSITYTLKVDFGRVVLGGEGK